MYIFLCTYTHLYVYLNIHIHIHAYTYTKTYIYAYMYIQICAFTYRSTLPLFGFALLFLVEYFFFVPLSFVPQTLVLSLGGISISLAGHF